MFILYRATLLPGFDFGDTGSFQTMAGSPFITPRDGYPLYFAIGDVFLWATRVEPARALNLASAVVGAVASGILVLAAAELSGSVVAGLAVALLFAGSYTFWSQAIIAEVYTLHAVFVAATLLLLCRWAERPTLARLSAFFAIYALGFGNHLSMVLLLPAYAFFLLVSAPGGWRSLLTPTIVALAAGFAAAGAMQYGWNLRTLWLLPDPPKGLAAIPRFWLDVTKSDWRATTVLDVPRSMLGDHLAMYAFDVRQQFGVLIPAFAVAGAGILAIRSWRRAALILMAYAANVLFAYSYNVGDAHVFFLPSHLLLALLAGVAIAALDKRLPRPHLAPALLVVYAAFTIYDNYPALDRSADRRPTDVIAGLTRGLTDDHDILLADLNWQIDNGLSYYGRAVRPDLAYARMPDVIQYAPTLIADNAAIGRDVWLTDRARAVLASTYGSRFRMDRDRRTETPGLADAARSLAPGSRYVLCVLKPARELAVDWGDVDRALGALGDGSAVPLPRGDYIALAGIAGRHPAFLVSGNRPFRRSFQLDGVRVDVRMESWLAADTIRRMGFGQVVAGRHHTLIVERGVSFAAFDRSGVPTHTAYAANLFAAQPRFLIYR